MTAGPNSGSGGGSGSAGVGGSGRRLISEFPPHIQQLLDQQERGSPLRRPVYRKLVAGSGVAPSIQYDGSLPTYLLPGTPSQACTVGPAPLLQMHAVSACRHPSIQ